MWVCVHMAVVAVCVPPPFCDFILKLTLCSIGDVIIGNVYSSLIGPEMKFKGVFHPIVVAPARIPDLNVVKCTDDGQ